MQFARVFGAQPGFPAAHIISIEVDLSKGLHAFTIVGLADKAIAEAKDRVGSAIKHSGFTSPKSKNQKVVISLAPADMKKEGPVFDLPVALAYLLATGDMRFETDKKLFAGELALDGTLRPVRGILPIAIAAKSAGFTELFVPFENANEASHVQGVTVYGARSLQEIIAHFKDDPATQIRLSPHRASSAHEAVPHTLIDLSDVRGQEIAKRGLIIAAAGRHNIVLYGPPGTGKTMLANALSGILPALTFDEAIEATAIHSLVRRGTGGLIEYPPLRSPHHTASYVSLVGGGAIPQPGEVTLAHRGILFLDEFPEFERRAIDALREPLENRTITVSRAKGSVTFPANFILVAAMNPTRGLGDHVSRQGTAWGAGNDRHDDAAALRERMATERKISGPIMDRIDMWIEVTHVPHEKLSVARKEGSESEAARAAVSAAREIQSARFSTPKTNSEMSVRDFDEKIAVSLGVKQLLNQAASKMNLSPRAYHRIIKLARTIADLEGVEHLGESHVLEALQYRSKNLFS